MTLDRIKSLEDEVSALNLRNENNLAALEQNIQAVSRYRERAEKAEAELERERMCHAICGVAALGGSIVDVKGTWASASVRAVVKLRGERDELARMVDELCRLNACDLDTCVVECDGDPEGDYADEVKRCIQYTMSWRLNYAREWARRGENE